MENVAGSHPNHLPRPIMNITPSARVLFRELNGESVLLDLQSQQYFGLDSVGTRFWQLVQQENLLSQIHQQLLTEYDVDSQTLHQDLQELIAQLQKAGLIIIHP